MIRLAPIFFALAACSAEAGGGKPTADDDRPLPAAALRAGQAEAIFAAGCFWCTEADFEKLDGVLSVDSGYIGGAVHRPTYEEVGRGRTGHTEAVRVVFDPQKTTYDALLTHYWRTTDLLDGAGQFCDRGPQYRPALFPVDDAQRAAAEAGKSAMAARFGRPVAVTIEPTAVFYVAESYHQDYFKKNPVHYTAYRQGCGRDARTAALWGSDAKAP
jgi:peptide-methionine (S)-S-oxide reductase